MLVRATLNRVLIVRCVSLFYLLIRVCHVFGPCFAFVQPTDTPWHTIAGIQCIIC